MEPIKYESIVYSKPFKFSVGPYKREFTIHSALVAHQSPPLKQLVNGEMREACEGHAVWEDIDEETFIRFAEYAYTGDYAAAQPTISLDWNFENRVAGDLNSSISKEMPAEPPPAEKVEDDFWFSASKKSNRREREANRKGTKKERLWYRFENASLPVPNSPSM